MKKIYYFVALLFSINLLAQPSGSQYRRTAVIDGNSFKSVIGNWGVIAQPGDINPRGTWMGENNVYFGDMSFVIGVELPIRDYTGNGIPDTIHSVIITPVSRPGGGDTGNFEPIDSFFNHSNTNPLQGIALSNIPVSWPVYWPDHPEYGTGVWNGLYGPDVFLGDQEAYFHIDDANDEEMYLLYGFLPDSTNPSRKGHGIRVGVRYVQLNHPLFEDILFKIYDIKNESLHNYSKVVFGELVGTYIGGENPEWNDDVSLYYPNDNFILSYDFNNFITPAANPNWEGRAGMFGQRIISSPNSNTITSFDYFVPAGNITMSNDEEMWWRLKPGFLSVPASVYYDPDSIPHAIRGEDGDYMYGSGYFNLNSGETKRIVNVISFGYNKDEILLKSKIAEALYHSNFDTAAIHNVISISNPINHQTISGNYNIIWNSNNQNGSVEIWYSGDAGETWDYIIKNSPNTGSYTWNTNSVIDGAFSKLIIFIKDTDGNIYGYDESGYFTVNNSGNGKPFIKILNEEIYTTTITEEDYDFNLLLGDPENDPLLLNIYYSVASDTNFYFSQTVNAVSDTAPQSYTLNMKIMPNSDQLKVKIEATDGLNYFIDITEPFAKQTQREIISPNNYQIVNSYFEIPVEIRLIDTTHFSSSEYYITFNDTLFDDHKTFSVYNTRYGTYTVLNLPFYPYNESPVFDGMTLYTEDISTSLDEVRSGWNNSHSQNLQYALTQFPGNTQLARGRKDPFDYAYIFSDTYNDSSNYLNQVFGSLAPPAKTNLNFKLFKIAENVSERIQFAFTESTLFRIDTLSHLDQVIFSNPSGTMVSWRMIFFGDSSTNVPSNGDTLYIYTKKGLSIYDTLRVYGLPVSVDDEKIIPVSYLLYQNYPNPFNPVTTISYTIPAQTNVEIKVFDILGREVKTLVNEFKTTGFHKIEFDASSLASGVYLYRIKTDDFISVKKMILMK